MSPTRTLKTHYGKTPDGCQRTRNVVVDTPWQRSASLSHQRGCCRLERAFRRLEGGLALAGSCLKSSMGALVGKNAPGTRSINLAPLEHSKGCYSRFILERAKTSKVSLLGGAPSYALESQRHFLTKREGITRERNTTNQRTDLTTSIANN